MNTDIIKSRVVITGYGMITPLGRNCEETFSNCSHGRSGIDYIQSFDTSGLPCHIGGEVSEAWIEKLENKDAQKYRKYSSRGFRLMQIATAEAAAQSGLSSIEDRHAIGVALGSHGENPKPQDMHHLHQFLDDNGNWDIQGLIKDGGYRYWNFFRRKPDVASSLLAAAFDCKGPNLTIVSACAAGSQAIGEALRLIEDQQCKVMIAGGCDALLDIIGMAGFLLLKALSEKHPTPQAASRPFDRRRNGFVMSEAAGALILEEREHALERGAPILGELKGYGASADAYRITDPHPKGLGAIIAMKSALDDAGLDIADIDYINAHGTSTSQNDLTETRAIRQIFGERADAIPVSSNKSMLGHSIAAAGAIECILSLMGINRSTILPTINQEFKDPKCNLDYVPNESRTKEHQTVLSNSFGFGGQNASLCISRYND